MIETLLFCLCNFLSIWIAEQKLTDWIQAIASLLTLFIAYKAYSQWTEPKVYDLEVDAITKMQKIKYFFMVLDRHEPRENSTSSLFSRFKGVTEMSPVSKLGESIGIIQQRSENYKDLLEEMAIITLKLNVNKTTKEILDFYQYSNDTYKKIFDGALRYDDLVFYRVNTEESLGYVLQELKELEKYIFNYHQRQPELERLEKLALKAFQERYG
jgi:hypothetical protein